MVRVKEQGLAILTEVIYFIAPFRFEVDSTPDIALTSGVYVHTRPIYTLFNTFRRRVDSILGKVQ